MSNLQQVGTTHLLTTSEVAERLGKSTATVNRWADSGKLPTAAKAPGLRGARLFAPDAVAEFERVRDRDVAGAQA